MLKLHFTDALRFWWSQLPALLLVALPFGLLEGATNLLLPLPFSFDDNRVLTFEPVPIAVKVLQAALIQGCLVGLLAALNQGKRINLSALIGISVFMLPGLLLVTVASYTAFLLGLMFFVLPGVWALMRLSQAPYLLVLEQYKPVDALRESLARTQPLQLSLVVDGTLLLFASLWLSATLSQGLAQLGDGSMATMTASVAETLLALPLEILAFRYYLLALPPPPPTQSGGNSDHQDKGGRPYH